MSNHYPEYSVDSFDSSVRLPSRGTPKKTCGLWRVWSRHNTFDEAFEAWKILLEGEVLFPCIMKFVTCVFDGYSSDDRSTLILSLEEARAIAEAKEAEAEKYFQQVREMRKAREAREKELKQSFLTPICCNYEQKERKII